MKLLTKASIAKKFIYTWPVYLALPIAAGFLCQFSYQAIHAIPRNETIEVFIGASVKDTGFVIPMVEKLDSIKAVEIYSCDPASSVYAQKLLANGLESSDLLILPKSTVAEFKDAMDQYFVSVDASKLNTSATINEYVVDFVKDSWSSHISFANEDYSLLFNAAGAFVAEGKVDSCVYEAAKLFLEGQA